ncbi:hypothetical protein HPP92_006274 [Vanilla planifolia]|uniref:Protein SDA1 n=1 Tax=Vanilla planifolia TaxID=51239 RepID=A0A835VFN2_VANPL|nr:hypothetical protein HPP92_006274 [Vanilla planifolia]
MIELLMLFAMHAFTVLEAKHRVMVSALSFLLGYERVDDDDSEASSDEDDEFYIITKMLVMGFPEKLFSPLHLMNEDLLQDFVLYKKLHEKAVSIVACSLITLLREICPSFLDKKDRGHPIDSKAKPKAFGKVSAANDVPVLSYLKQDDDEPLYTSSEDEMAAYGSEAENDSSLVDSDICARVAYKEDKDSIENDRECDNEFFSGSGQSSGIDGLEDDAYRNDSDEEGSDDRELANVCDTEELNEEIEVQAIPIIGQDEDADDGKDLSNGKKRKLGNFVECLNAVDARPHSLKRLVIKAAEVSTDEADGILSNEDFQHIKELKDEGYKAATSEIPSSEQLSAKRVNPVKLEAHVRSKLSKQERVALIQTGGLSNRQK